MNKEIIDLNQNNIIPFNIKQLDKESNEALMKSINNMINSLPDSMVKEFDIEIYAKSGRVEYNEQFKLISKDPSEVKITLINKL